LEKGVGGFFFAIPDSLPIPQVKQRKVAMTAGSSTLDIPLVKSNDDILGHPRGLFVLFLTEMWERMSYYGMRALLTLYMVDYLFVQNRGGTILGFVAIKAGLESVFGPMSVQAFSSQIYGLYTGFVYLTPVFGGIVADRYLGPRKTVILGAVLMAFGHFLMASEQLFFLALIFLIVGNGAFKPNVSTQVGSLYEDGDPRRDRAYTIFYMGVNLGAFLSPLICGTLGQVYGWHYGFGAAGVGMMLSLVIYIGGRKYLAESDAKTRQVKMSGKKEKLTRAEWRTVGALVALCLLNIVFWAAYEQQGNTMQLWADHNTDWHLIPGVTWEIPSTWFQSFNPLFIFMLAPVLDAFWGWQSLRKKEPSSVMKMAIGCILLGLGFVVMIVGASVIGQGLGSVWWLVSCTFVLTLGELFLSPIGLSLVSKAAPKRIVSMMMGIWFLSSFFGNYLSGYIGTFYEKMPKSTFFMILCFLGIASGIAIWSLNQPIKRALGSKA
jgi:POT family proton-dependent oligopeptide transporter